MVTRSLLTHKIPRRLGNLAKILDFDGIDDYVDCGNDASLSVTGDLTIEFYFKVHSLPSTVYKIVEKQWQEFAVKFDQNQKKIIFEHTGGEWEAIHPLVTDIQLNTWCHIALTRDIENAQMRGYKNGVLDQTKSFSETDIVSSTYPVLIGCEEQDRYWFDGEIALVRIYNRVLSASEVKRNYRSVLGNSDFVRDGLVLFLAPEGLNFGDNVWHDLSDYNNHGVIYGATLIFEKIGGG